MSWDAVFRTFSPAVVRIATTSCDDSGSFGSGFALDEQTVVTAAHVVDDARTISLQTPGGRTVTARPIVIAPENDTAVLHVEEGVGATAYPNLAGKVPDRGSELAVIGYPLGDLQVSIVNGIVSRLPAPVDYAQQHVDRVFTTNASTNAGNSGGPVFDEQGKVIGLVSGGQDWTDDNRPVQGINFMVPVEDISVVVGRASDSGRRADPCEGSGGADGPEDARGPVLTFEEESEEARYVGQLLYTHGLAINIGAYDAAFSLFTSSAQRNLGGLEAWSRGVEKSYWRELVVEDAKAPTTRGVVTARVRLRTSQPPEGDITACSLWHLSYDVVIDSELLINKVRALGPRVSC
ncbi:serine protease [Rothia sp. ARF10]|nr:serine protease [Rothia sp. ARF10]